MINNKKSLSKIQKETDRIRRETRKKVATYLGAAFGLVAGLAWNDAIKALIDHLFPLTDNSVLAKFAYAIGITVVVVVLSIYLVRLFKEEEKEGEKT